MNPYDVLGVSADASDDDISRAYKKLARTYHPDLHPGDQAAADKMSQINSAYNDIKQMRARGESYAQYEARRNPGARSGPSGASGASGAQTGQGGTTYTYYNPFTGQTYSGSASGAGFDPFSAFFYGSAGGNRGTGGQSYNTANNGYQQRTYYRTRRTNPIGVLLIVMTMLFFVRLLISLMFGGYSSNYYVNGATNGMTSQPSGYQAQYYPYGGYGGYTYGDNTYTAGTGNG